MVESVPHASPLVAPTRRHVLTAAGVERLAELDAGSPGENTVPAAGIPAVAAGAAGTAGRCGRHLPPGLRRQPGVSPPGLPLVPGHAPGRGDDPARRQDFDRGAPGQHRRPDRLRQARLAVGAVDPHQRRADAAARRGSPAPGSKAGGGIARPGIPGPGERRRFRRSRCRRLAHSHRPRPPGPANGIGPHRAPQALAPAEAAPAGRNARRSGRRRRVPAAVRAQTRGEAGRGPAGRLALAVASTPGRIAGRKTLAPVPGEETVGGVAPAY